MTIRASLQMLVLACATLVMWPGGALHLDAAGSRFLLAVEGAALSDVLTEHGLIVDDDEIREHGVYRVRDPQERDRAALTNELRADLRIAGFEPDRPRVITERPSGLALDQSTDAILEVLTHGGWADYHGAFVPRAYVEQPAAALVGVQAAHAWSTGGVVVAVIDTGIDPHHPALRQAIVEGYDFTREAAGSASELADLPPSIAARLQQSTDAILEQSRLVVLNRSTLAVLPSAGADAAIEGALPPAFGHGTMVAGLIHLVAPTARLMPLKAFRADGSATLFDLVRAVYYAVDHGARVINMSFSMAQPSVELSRALRYAYQRGVVLTSSAGNTGRLVEHLFPASLDVVLGIASTSNGDLRSLFSNYGNDTVDLAAPGEGLVTTYPGGGYALVWGTSFSTALASGGASLLVWGRPQNPHDEAERVQQSVLSAQPVDRLLGAGRLDLLKAVQARARGDAGE